MVGGAWIDAQPLSKQADNKQQYSFMVLPLGYCAGGAQRSGGISTLFVSPEGAKLPQKLATGAVAMPPSALRQTLTQSPRAHADAVQRRLQAGEFSPQAYVLARA